MSSGEFLSSRRRVWFQSSLPRTSNHQRHFVKVKLKLDIEFNCQSVQINSLHSTPISQSTILKFSTQLKLSSLSFITATETFSSELNELQSFSRQIEVLKLHSKELSTKTPLDYFFPFLNFLLLRQKKFDTRNLDNQVHFQDSSKLHINTSSENISFVSTERIPKERTLETSQQSEGNERKSFV